MFYCNYINSHFINERIKKKQQTMEEPCKRTHNIKNYIKYQNCMRLTTIENEENTKYKIVNVFTKRKL